MGSHLASRGSSPKMTTSRRPRQPILPTAARPRPPRSTWPRTRAPSPPGTTLTPVTSSTCLLWFSIDFTIFYSLRSHHHQDPEQHRRLDRGHGHRGRRHQRRGRRGGGGGPHPSQKATQHILSLLPALQHQLQQEQVRDAHGVHPDEAPQAGDREGRDHARGVGVEAVLLPRADVGHLEEQAATATGTPEPNLAIGGPVSACRGAVWRSRRHEGTRCKQKSIKFRVWISVSSTR